MRVAVLMLAPLLVLLPAAGPDAPPPRLLLPVECRLGSDCAIQNYVDADPGPGVRDHGCGARSYDGHDGIDIRLTSMALERRGVAVRAAAAGTVLRTRDGVTDVSIRDAPGAASGQECGNGLVIGHGGGWETQYCHVAKGSVVVRPGQQVAAGAALGRVGLSGNTEFPHLHLTVRKDGKAIDPFAWGRAAGRCRGGISLWAATPAYGQGQVLVAGFAAGPVTMAAVQDTGAVQMPAPGRTMPLVAFVQAIGLAAGDVQRLVVSGPDGAVLADGGQPPLDRDKAQTLIFAGRKPPTGGWPAGRYRAAFSVTRAGRIVIQHIAEVGL